MERYLHTNEIPKIESSVRVLRKALSYNKNVTIAVIGMMNNIALLLKSEPDDISSLNGIELVKSSVKNMYVMGGNFADLTNAEYNIKCDIESAQYVSLNFPAPITYCGFEIGISVLTGKLLETAAEGNPVKFAYRIKAQDCGNQNYLRYSWDPITVYCAVEQDTSLYTKSDNVTVSFDDMGRTVLQEGGKDCYLIDNSSAETVQAVIDELIY